VDEQVSVAYVYDGDTVRLGDGRKVRLIGLDTPEIGRKREPSQPLSKEARAALEAKLHSSKMKAGLRYDKERHDRYGRVLAHLYGPNGSDLAAELIAEGMGSTLAVPPNLWNFRCLSAQELNARAARRGVWKLAAYQGTESTELTAASSGFHRVFGKVKKIRKTKKAVWLNLEGGLTVRIPRRNLRYFDAVDLFTLRGRRIEVRGRVYTDKRRLQMTIQHPSAILALP
jgi:endonuclease YncB( thermonuclease family)